MTEVFDWRKLRVHRDDCFEPLIERLCSTKGRIDKSFLFSTVKELMVFAALIGYQLNEFRPLSSKNNTTSIALDTYSTTEHDSYIYLIALAKSQSLDILNDERVKDAIGIFEGYCNAGLLHIDNWILNNPAESIIENILFDQTLKYLMENE